MNFTDGFTMLGWRVTSVIDLKNTWIETEGTLKTMRISYQDFEKNT